MSLPKLSVTAGTKSEGGEGNLVTESAEVTIPHGLDSSSLRTGDREGRAQKGRPRARGDKGQKEGNEGQRVCGP